MNVISLDSKTSAESSVSDNLIDSNVDVPIGSTMTTNGSVAFDVYKDFTQSHILKERRNDLESHYPTQGGWGVAVCFPSGYNPSYYSVNGGYWNKTSTSQCE